MAKKRKRKLFVNLAKSQVGAVLTGMALAQIIHATHLDDRFNDYLCSHLPFVTQEQRPEDYNGMYRNLRFSNPEMKTGAFEIADFIQDNKEHYKTIERRTGVPWYVVGTIHMRESSGDFSTYLHNGEQLGKTTKKVPKGIFFDNWEEASEDAIKRYYEDNQEEFGTLEALERYNGLGYRNKRCKGNQVNSPYLWSGSQHYKQGKYIRDGVFTCNAVDKQLGTATMIKAMQKKGYIQKPRL